MEYSDYHRTDRRSWNQKFLIEYVCISLRILVESMMVEIKPVVTKKFELEHRRKNLKIQTSSMF